MMVEREGTATIIHSFTQSTQLEIVVNKRETRKSYRKTRVYSPEESEIGGLLKGPIQDYGVQT